MRPLLEIRQEFGDLSTKIGVLAFRKRDLEKKIEEMMVRLAEVENEHAARQLFDESLAAEKAAEQAKTEQSAEVAEAPKVD